MFWKFWSKKQKKEQSGPTILETKTVGNLEITRVRTSKPILPAKPGIRIEGVTPKRKK